MKRMLTVATSTAALAILAAGPAVAGEWNRNGDRTGAYEKGAASACFFSGLDEDFVRGVDSDGDPFTKTQNYGQIIAMLGPELGMAVAPSPGLACNPNGGDFEH